MKQILIWWLLFIATTTFNHSAADVITVGQNIASCGYTGDIQTAIDAANPGDEISVSNEQIYPENLFIDKNLTLSGGYTDCEAATADIRIADTKTTINGMQQGNVIKITGTDATVYLNHIIATDGVNEGEAAGQPIGAGISIYGAGTYTVHLSHMELINNHAYDGGGLMVLSETAEVHIEDTLIKNNMANWGGGIYCYGATLNIYSGTVITDNLADGDFVGVANGDGNGGGIYSQSCQLNMIQQHSDASPTNIQFINNQAYRQGGGMYLWQSTLEHIHTGGEFQAIIMNENKANSDQISQGAGGAIYTANQTQLDLSAFSFKDNVVYNGFGGALNSVGSIMKVNDDLVKTCLQSQQPCLVFSGNQAINTEEGLMPSRGGALFIDWSTVAEGTLVARFDGNQADQGSALSLHDTEMQIQNSFFINHGNQGLGNTADQSVIETTVGTTLDISFSTFAQNQTQTTLSIDQSTQNIYATLFSGDAALNTTANLINAADFHYGCSVFHEAGSFGGIAGGTNSITTQQPGFNNGDMNDFSLSHDSVAIDRCTAPEFPVLTDRDGTQRPYDVPGIDQGSGQYDVGADEWQDAIFTDDFEGSE